MGFFDKLKGKGEDFTHLQDPSSSSSKKEAHSAPPPPPGYDANPPGYSSFNGGSSSSSVPPPAADGPPPGYMEYADSRPAPPIRSHMTSTINASEESAVRGHKFGAQYPLYSPVKYSEQQLDMVRRGELGLQQPQEFQGQIIRTAYNTSKVTSMHYNQESMLLSTLPVYSAIDDRPTEKGKKLIYFEVKIISLAKTNRNSSIAIGFSALPQPAWRLPGWHRGSIGVHSDDGRRYINDSYGGREFTEPFRPGETIGIGMRFQMNRAEAFVLRNGRESGSWWVDEEVDREDVQFGGITGLQGESDLYASIGVYGDAEIEVDFKG